MNIAVALFPLVVLISLGYLFKRTQFLKAEFWRGAEQLNYYVLFPMLLFSNLAFATIDFDSVKLTLAAMIVVILLCCVALWTVKHFCNIPAARFGVYVQSHIRYNTYMGLVIMAPLFGAPGVQLFAMIMVVAIPLVNTISVIALTESQLSWRTTVLSVVKNPLILGCLSGFAFNLTGIELFSGLTEALKLLGGTSLSLGLLCIGAGLQFAALQTALPRLFVNTAGRLLLVPLLAFGVTYWMGLGELESAVLVVFFGLPTATAAFILTKMLNGDSELMAGIISLQTLCFALTFPVMMSLLF